MPVVPSMPASQRPVMPTSLPDGDKATRAAELQARIQSKLAIVGLGAASGTAQSGYL